MDNFIKYLLIVNGISFLLSFIGILASRKREDDEIMSGLRGLLAMIGAPCGNILAFLILDRRSRKANMTVNVLSFTSLIIYGVIAAVVYGPFQLSKENFWDNILNVNRYFLIYLAAVTLLTFILFGIDKYKAIKGKGRISILTLFFFSAIGGTVGGIVGMYLFRHKTKKVYFTLGMPMILLAQIAVLVFLFASGII